MCNDGDVVFALLVLHCMHQLLQLQHQCHSCLLEDHILEQRRLNLPVIANGKGTAQKFKVLKNVEVDS